LLNVREPALNLSQFQKVRKTKLSFTLTANDIHKKIHMTGRVFAVEMMHIKEKVIHLRDSWSKKEVYKTYVFVIIVN